MSKTPSTIRRETYKKTLTELIKEKQEARLVKNRLKVLKYILSKEYPNFFLSMKNWSPLNDFLKEVLYCDRIIRLYTQEYDKEQKKILSQEYQIKELGAEVNPLNKSFLRALENDK